MRAKLAVRNIKRSFKDYAIYFVTLVFGVAVFYAFNSIHSQSILFDLEEEAGLAVFEMTGQFLGMFSVLIACVLGFLIIYANRFLIKRRKHEFGIYLTLGMKPSSVSHIVLLETFLVGLVSLVIGMALGIALSQGLSFFTAALFNVPMGQYQFVFSGNAFVLTLLCFVLIYVVVGAFNTLTVRRYKLIDLLSARSKNEKLKMRNPWVSLVLFAASVAILAVAYLLLAENGLVDMGDPKFTWATVLMILGTTLFFYALSGFAILIMQRSRGLYYKNLNTFTVRQIASKINTAFVSLSLVCVMLFFSITVFSCGMGLVEAFTGGVEKGTRYDASLTANIWWDTMNLEQADAEYQADAERVLALAKDNDYDIRAYLEKNGVDFDSFAKDTAQVDVYQYEGLAYGDLEDIAAAGFSEEQTARMTVAPLQLIGVAQFNAVRAMTGEDPIDLGEGGYIVNNINDSGIELSKRLATREGGVDIAGTHLSSVDGVVYEQPTDVHSFSSDLAQLVVPDAVIESLNDGAPYLSTLNIDYIGSRDEGDQALSDALAAALPPSETESEYGSTYHTDSWPVSNKLTATEVLLQAGGMRMMITYLALYIGFVFLITTAAVLAIQQLSEANDSMGRYRLLSKLGCDKAMISRSLLAQVLIYFLAPLGLAVCHAACAIGVLGNTLFQNLGISIAGTMTMTVVLVVGVYGMYLLLTYLAARGIVRSAVEGRR